MVLFKSSGKISVAPDLSMDERPLVSDLLAKYSEEVESVRELVSEDNPLYDAKIHDELWLLRFFLSQKKVPKAAAAARKAIEYRNKLGLDSIKTFEWAGTFDDDHVPECWLPYTTRCGRNGVIGCQPDGDRGIIEYIDLAKIPMHLLASEVSLEEVRVVQRIAQEFQFRVLDEVTRRTGRLTKAIRVIDMKNVKLSDISRKYLVYESKIAKEIEDFYPQKADTIFVYNAPSWVQYLFKTFSPLFPRRLTQKVTIVTGSSDECLPDDSAIFKYMSPAHLPTKYGGENDAKIPPGKRGPPECHGIPATPPGVHSMYEDIDYANFGRSF